MLRVFLYKTWFKPKRKLEISGILLFKALESVSSESGIFKKTLRGLLLKKRKSLFEAGLVKSIKNKPGTHFDRSEIDDGIIYHILGCK